MVPVSPRPAILIFGLGRRFVSVAVSGIPKLSGMFVPWSGSSRICLFRLNPNLASLTAAVLNECVQLTNAFWAGESQIVLKLGSEENVNGRLRSHRGIFV